MRARLDAELIFDGDELLELLNDPPAKLANPSKPLRPKRTPEAAAELQRQLRELIDQWIDSGIQDESEAPFKRSISRVERTQYVRTPNPGRFLRNVYWFRQRVTAAVNFRNDDKPCIEVRFSDSDHTNIYAAETEAGILQVKLLMTDFRFRIAKCKYSECKRPYFLLTEKQCQKVYKNGTFCATEHNRKASATRRTEKRRDNCKEKQIEWAAAELRAIHKTRKRRQTDEEIKKRLVRAVNDGLARYPERVTDEITAKWVTQHWKEIEEQSKEMSHATN